MYCIVKRKLILTTLWTSREYFYILFRFRFLLEFLISRGTQLRFPPKCIEIGFYAIKSTFWSWECILISLCLVILGQLEPIRI